MLAGGAAAYWVNRWYGISNLGQAYVVDNVMSLWQLIASHPFLRFVLNEQGIIEEIKTQMERPAWLISTLLATGLAFFVISNLVQDWQVKRDAMA